MSIYRGIENTGPLPLGSYAPSSLIIAYSLRYDTNFWTFHSTFLDKFSFGKYLIIVQANTPKNFQKKHNA